MLDELKKYIKDALGIDIEINALEQDKLKKLPIYLRNEYKLFSVSILNRKILFVEIIEDFTISVLKKQLEQLGEKLGMNTVAIINHLEAYKRQRLIEKKISFIIPGKQMYMPNLFIDLKEFGSAKKKLPKTMTPATQFMILYHLQVEPLVGINLKNIAEKLMYDSATITRSVHYLQTMNLCEFEHKSAKEKLLNFKLSKEEIWEKTLPLMSSPVKKVHYFNGKIKDKRFYITNNNALAHYSDLNDDIIKYYAVKSDNMKLLDNKDVKKTAIMEGNICIEEWKYEPSILASGGFVDPLSLYLCFKDTVDERVEMALEQLINSVKW